MTKAERTRARLLEAALGCFERDGYESTTVAAVARAAGVSEMTFFRHFGSKEALLLDDPYDPVMVEALAAQPRDVDPLDRTVAALRASWGTVPAGGAEVIRRRLRVAARTPALRGAVWRNNARTEDLLVGRLVEDGADPVTARMSVAAVLAALMASLLGWAEAEEPEGAEETTGPGAAVSLDDAVYRALDLMERR